MKQPKKRKKVVKRKKHHPEAIGMLFISISLFLFLAVTSYSTGHYETNWLGLVGHSIAYSAQYLFGLGSYLLILYFFWLGWQLVKTHDMSMISTKTFYFVLFLSSSCILLNCFAETGYIAHPKILAQSYSESVIIHSPLPVKYTRYNLGGVPFYYLFADIPYCSLQRLLSNFGVFCTFSIVFVVSFILISDLSFFYVAKKTLFSIPKVLDLMMHGLKKIHLAILQFLSGGKKEREEEMQDQLTPLSIGPSYEGIPPYTPMQKTAAPRASYSVFDQEEEEEEEEEITIDTPPSAPRQISLQGREREEKSNREMDRMMDKKILRSKNKPSYTLPPLNLLTNAKKVDQPSLKRDLTRQAEILEETLLSFGIEAKVGEINCGPTITSFEVHPAIGVKVQKITALSNDIALKLQATSIRIIAPIPGKAAVGVEVPSPYPQEVGFKEMLFKYRRTPSKFQIPILLGKTVSGENVMCDLTKMPHCIIAGATGSGKSVCINTIIMSLLMNMGPEDVKLILIDPKKVELTPYTRLPHMIAPVITEPGGAHAALHWIVKEMTARYELLKHLGVRNITAFNERKIDPDLEDAFDIEVPEKLPYIVAIIDEFADLMMSAGTDLETPIARIAQMARAVGIHLILATQRPSREVITGLIKANFPCRIAFKVASRINSQIILDETGAETLLGNGDLLFLPPGTSALTRAQGVYIRDEDINRVIDFICSRHSTDYLFSSFDQMSFEELAEQATNSDSKDPLYERALEIVLTSRNASTTFLQRKLKIGYARAASLMDELEDNHVIGPQEGSKPRRILQSRDDFSQ